MDDSHKVVNDLMDQYGQAIWNYIYGMTKDVHLANDLSQDVFIKAYTRLGTFRNHSTVKTWLFSIAHNCCYDHFRSSFVRRIVLTEDPNQGVSPSVEDEVLKCIENDEVLQMFLKLKKEYREIVLLRIREDMGFHEIGELLGISEGNARVRYRRAIQTMQKAIKKGNDVYGC